MGNGVVVIDLGSPTKRDPEGPTGESPGAELPLLCPFPQLSGRTLQMYLQAVIIASDSGHQRTIRRVFILRVSFYCLVNIGI